MKETPNDDIQRAFKELTLAIDPSPCGNRKFSYITSIVKNNAADH